MNNAWDVGVHGSAGIKWLSARYPSIPRPSQSAPQVSFSRRSGGNFHALLGKHFPGHIFNYSESRADSHPSGSLSHTHTHTRPTPTLNKLCLKRKWGAREDRDAGLSSCDTSDKQRVCSECLPAFSQCQTCRGGKNNRVSEICQKHQAWWRKSTDCYPEFTKRLHDLFKDLDFSTSLQFKGIFHMKNENCHNLLTLMSV